MYTEGAIITLELGHYRLRERLAGSAYGVVWRASGPRGTRDVALKLVNREQMERALPDQRACWIASARNEIAFLQSLEPWDERHIVRLLDSGEHEGLPVLALELVNGDLAQHMARLHGAGRQLPLGQILDWVGQINQALAKVHQYGWAYLDLKPANVLLDSRLAQVKLADFGTNRLLEARPALVYAGTASWQAPEQFFPDQDGAYATCARSDYFALGALFFFLVTGTALRFCDDCGLAYRSLQSAAPQWLRQRAGGLLPATLHTEEAARFNYHVGLATQTERAAGSLRGARLHGGADVSGDVASATAALALLRTLLAPLPQERPAHAIEISRMLAGIRGAAGDQAADLSSVVGALRRPSAQNGWPPGVCAAKGVEAKLGGKEPGFRPLLSSVAVAADRKISEKWGLSPPVSTDELLPRKLLGAPR